MDKLNDNTVSIKESIDEFAKYNFNRYKTYLRRAVKKAQGEATFESEIAAN